MASSFEWCQEKLSQLTNDETRVPALLEMKDYLSNLSRDEIHHTANSLQLSNLFECLNDTNNEQVDLACEVLSLCMTGLNLGQDTNRYGSLMEQALAHSHAGVKMLALNELKKNIQNEDILLDLCRRESLLIAVVKCLLDIDVGVTVAAANVLEIVGQSESGIQKLTKGEVLKQLFDAMVANETSLCTVYEVLIKISAQSENHFNILKAAGLFSNIIRELDSNDPLFKVNVLELLSEFGVTKHGFEFFETEDVFNKLIYLLNDEDKITLQLCEPGMIKFFGKLAHWKPIELLSKYPQLFQKLFDNFERDDLTIIGVSLDTLGYIGLSNSGKIALNSTGTTVENIIRKIAKTLVSYPNEIKERALNCIENLLRVLEPNNQISNITHKWYNLLGDNPMELILNYAKTPFIDLRLAGLGVLSALSTQYWGQEAINDTPGLIEFLLDRNVETTKECKEAKFAIIESLVNSQVFEENVSRKIQKYIKEGPFYVEAQIAVERAE